MKKSDISILFFISIIVILFIFSSYITNQSVDFFKGFIDNGLKGMFTYMLLITLEIVFAPISVVPLIPIATAIWGWFISGILVLIGWTIGSLFAFGIARRGAPILEKRYAFKKIRKVENIIPEQNVFFGIILLRLTIPFDLMSYAIGIFSGVDWKVYTAATLIGYAPLAFFLAYLGTFSLTYQIILFILGIIVVSFFIKKYHRDEKLKNKIKNGWKKKFKEKEA